MRLAASPVVGLACVLLVSLGCSHTNDVTDSPQNGTLSAKIDGGAFAPDVAYFVRISTDLCVAGRPSDSNDWRFLEFCVHGAPTGPGTVMIEGAAWEQRDPVNQQSLAIWNSLVSGSCTFSSVAAGHLQGTFSFVLSHNNYANKNVTEGSFDVYERAQ